MPSHEQGLKTRTSNSQETGASDYIFAHFEPSGATDSLNKSRQATLGVTSYETFTRNIDAASAISGEYIKYAGTSLSTLFYPYETTNIQANSTLPRFNSTTSGGIVDGALSQLAVAHKNLLPFSWDINQSGHLYDMSKRQDDSLSRTMSSDEFPLDINRYRDVSRQRGIGMRLPMMGVGWGYTHEGTPFPSGSKTNMFAGNVSSGNQMAPDEYIAAPIDLRYDKDRNVWTAPREGFWAKIIQGSGSGPYCWQQRTGSFIQGSVGGSIIGGFTTNGLGSIGSLSGYGDPGTSVVNPAWPVTLVVTNVPSGTFVYMRYTDQQSVGSPNNFIFEAPFQGVFRVRVNKDGGTNADGPNQSSSWTYTVKSIDNDFVLGTQIMPETPRPFGNMIFNPSGYGTAYFDSQYTFHLIDAGEFPDTIFCDLTY